MMILEREGIAEADLPVAALAAHMRMPEGWSDVPGQGARLVQRLRAAISAVEARVGKALILREFHAEGDVCAARVALSLAPVVEVTAVEADGRAVASFGVERDVHRVVVMLPRAPVAPARLAVTLRAGFGTWDEVPAALQEAVMRAAEAMDLGETSVLPGAVSALLAPWRAVRLGAGT
ncbi:hypothetical protein JQC91_10925 [Jannaschia sp. Os4]|uniref:head-tail connector protein n=1 Tax=Jannaschia sp. Os4 TaxID=2807617 RepID=UPI0019399770|nr:hypothetical protein [Jannaschia sp. Os4]MBM2576816.1 hypothetical protein [Jannaschia sp. Os4]